MTYTVIVSAEATEDLERLADHLFERELLPDLHQTGDLENAADAIAHIRASFFLLKRFPFTCRKAADSSFLRELVIPFGHTGYVALFEIVAREHIVIAAIRHQREDDYL